MMPRRSNVAQANQIVAVLVQYGVVDVRRTQVLATPPVADEPAPTHAGGPRLGIPLGDFAPLGGFAPGVLKLVAQGHKRVCTDLVAAASLRMTLMIVLMSAVASSTGRSGR